MTLRPDKPIETAANRLRAARGVIADVAHHTRQELRDACRTVLELSEDGDERQEAEGLLAFFAEPGGSTSCAKS